MRIDALGIGGFEHRPGARNFRGGAMCHHEEAIGFYDDRCDITKPDDGTDDR